MVAGIGEVAVRLVADYGLVVLFVFMFCETSLTFPFVPSELVLPVGAAALISGPASFLAFVLVVTAGATVGSLFAYYVFDRAYQPVIDRYGAYVHVSVDEVERARRWFRRWGESSVCWGRLLPVVRSIISVPAGIAGMHPGKFAVYSATGSGLFATGVAAVVVVGLDVMPSQLVVGWLDEASGQGVAYALANPVPSVAVAGMALFAVLAVRNAYSQWLSLR